MGNELIYKLNKLGQFFNLEKVATQKVDQSYIEAYYWINKIPYSLFHNKKGFVHMGVSVDGIYKEEDLFYQVKMIDKAVKSAGAQKVLEIATGRGGNATWLASANPHVDFIGLDISESQLTFARKKAFRLNNYTVLAGDFHDLSSFELESFDVVFIIEALCHSSDTKKVLKEVLRILKKGGLFSIYDGYREKQDEQMSKEELLAARLLEVGVAVEHFELHSEFLDSAKQVGFTVENIGDLSDLVLPTMQRFEKQAGRFLKLGSIARFLMKLVPNKFVYNILSGYLFTTLIRERVFSYKYTLLKKLL
ncbi:MAG: hypothetical protein A3G60_01665 [Candidatus Ryanbacteria bacterium RIFCSPLOWO2_12_FULL_47_9c]|uniref:Methyltransferase domain-containing protein n=1 Tax=Candidatus Ryanbacteria bacterium RIFCSPLOWO2_12_FULL_47_9c TaxID=1802131 RepID=A0A1G2H5I0_9BACT|nr:MAG: hypothetical protein A3G60_01665 [Candidatus Ryanbacteria bacterium RIFCSPLOWO2_12_FULL_47_9c]